MVVFYRADMVYNQRMAVAQQRKCSCSRVSRDTTSFQPQLQKCPSQDPTASPWPLGHETSSDGVNMMSYVRK